jgi:uncharacterized membrane protein (DUF106 family)
MPEWLWPIIIGGVILGLVSLIYGIQSQRVTDIEKWKETRPMADEILTKSSHAAICKDNMKEIKDVLIDNREILIKHVELLKEHLDLKLERDILSELRKLNNK